MSVKIFLMIKVLKCIFWGCIFDVRLWFEMYFLREQFWCAPMFLKCIFSGSNFEEHLCSEMHFLREQLFWRLWLLISVAAALCFSWLLISLAAALYFLSKFSPQVQLLQYWHVSGGICLEWLPPLWKSSDSLVRVWVTNSVA